MGDIDEFASVRFTRWEERGRGYKVWPHPVAPEPPFCPFLGFVPPRPDVPQDDGRKPGFLASLFDRVHTTLNTKVQENPGPEGVEPQPEPWQRQDLAEFQALLPANADFRTDAFVDFLSQAAVFREPIAFELLATEAQITTQYVASLTDAAGLKSTLDTFFPEAAFLPVEQALQNAWTEAQNEMLVVEFGLEQPFFTPLPAGRKLDPFVGLVGAMSGLQRGELALLQVIFQSAENQWNESVLRMVANEEGKPRFVNRPEWVKHAENKFSSRLHAAVIRIAAKSDDFDRTLAIARELACSLRVFGDANANALIPLHNKDYSFEAHEQDVLLRQSHRSGMLLNTEELAEFVHLPSSDVRSPQLVRQLERTKAAPQNVTGNRECLLGRNCHLGKTVDVGLTGDQRVRHAHIIGAPGSGKSNLLFNLILQSIRNGEGLAVLDPHGDLIDKILACIPNERIDDVILVDPSDEEYSVPFNILSAHSAIEKRLIASDLTAVFQRLSTSWGDQMTSVLNNATLAFLESSEGGTLADLRRFLIEPVFRNQFLRTVNDSNVVYYWQKGFPLLSGNRSIGPLLTRLDMLLAPKPISHMVSQRANRLDFAAIMAEGKIFLAKLSHGTIGMENSALLGSLFMAKFHLAAMARQSLPEASRRNFYIFLDEAHQFATPSMVEILTGARKYHVGLTLAHQELGQLERVKEIAGAIMGCATRIVFRVTDNDARKLSEGFSYFEAQDLQNLEVGDAICRVERSDHDFNSAIPLSEEPDQAQAATMRQAVIQSSRAKYATPRAEVEASLRQALETDEPAKAQSSPSPRIADEKASEVQKPTVSEKEKLTVEAQIETKSSAPVVPNTPVVKPAPEDKGIGGYQHNLIRERIEAVARARGYEATREKKTATGQKIDLALDRQQQPIIACEISLTTTVDHEVGNVAKCLKAGYGHVAAISIDRAKLRKIQHAVAACLSPDETARVGFYLPDEFIEYLKSLKLPEGSATTPQQAVLGKYKITRRTPALTEDELKRREALSHKVLAETMRLPR